jgi:hypothetical protein
MKRVVAGLVSLGVVAAVVAGYFALRGATDTSKRSGLVRRWIINPTAQPDWAVKANTRCADAPFLFPSDGFIGYLWGDTFQSNHPHQGIDLFSGAQAGITPVYAAFDGYLTRMTDWKSTVVIRIPSDPLDPGRQIWTYYTHMAYADGSSTIAADFPPGTSEVFVKAGTLLGTQGNYSGTVGSPVGVHLHFSIVKDDGSGHLTNESLISNTLDPSPYFGLDLNAGTAGTAILTCND